MVDDYASDITRLLINANSEKGGVGISVDDFSYSVDKNELGMVGSMGDNLASIYEELVPSVLSQEEFWARYCTVGFVADLFVVSFLLCL